jgi:hypothetical protein
LLARLERYNVFTRRTLEVHCKPNRPNHQPCDPGCDVLRNLETLFVRKLFDLDIIGLDLSLDHCAICVGILRLNRCDRLRISARAANEHDAKHRDAKYPTHNNPPLPR